MSSKLPENIPFISQFDAGTPTMPDYLVAIPYQDPYLQAAQQVVPGLNVFTISPMHMVYDEAETVVINAYLQDELTREQFIRFYDRRTQTYVPVPPQMGNIYDKTLVWPLKAYQYFFASDDPKGRRYLESVFGSLEYTDPQSGKLTRVAIVEAYQGPISVMLNCAYAGTMLSTMVEMGASNPTVVIANINGPTIDPTVAAGCAMASALNIPVILWKDDVRMMYNVRENPIVTALQTNQTTIRSAPQPLNMGIDPSMMFSYLQTVALPIQKAYQEKNRVLLAPTFLEYFKKNLWYSLSNPFVSDQTNRFIKYPIPRDKQSGSIVLPPSLVYGRLMAFGQLLLDIRNEDGEGLQDTYEKYRDMDHSHPTWAVQMGKVQWEFVIAAMKLIYSADEVEFWRNLNFYFSPLDGIDMHFIIKFIVEGVIVDKGKVAARYIPPRDISM